MKKKVETILREALEKGWDLIVINKDIRLRKAFDALELEVIFDVGQFEVYDMLDNYMGCEVTIENSECDWYKEIYSLVLGKSI